MDHHEHQHNHNHSAHNMHAGHSPGMFRQKFWLSLALTVPIVALSHTVAGFFGYDVPEIPLIEWVSPILGTVLFFYSGVVFLRSARHEIAMKKPGMMTLISLAITVAFIYSWAVSLGLTGMDFWWELATLITIMVLGHWLEMKSIEQAHNALGELAKLLPDTAELLQGDAAKMVEASSLKKDDIVLVRPGARVPADGVVVAGSSSVDEALLTGESLPQKKRQGSSVIGGSINKDGVLQVRVSALPGGGVLGGIMDAVKRAGESKSHTQVLADRFAGWLFYAALCVATITLIYWLIVGGQTVAFIVERVVTVLIVACPHALGLAVPLVVSIASSRAAKSGLLVRSREGLESLRNIDAIVFDKTGTLTTGEQSVVAVLGNNERDIVEAAAAVEHASEHSIAKAIINYAHKQGIRYSWDELQHFTAIKGEGVRADMGDVQVLAGNERLLGDYNIAVEVPIPEKYKAYTTIYVARGGRNIGAIVLGDSIRDESREAIETLQQMGIQVVLLTGDNEGVAKAVAEELDIAEYKFSVLPEEKASVIHELQAGGKHVAMVGDGVNDAPALTQADVGIAIGAGTDVAVESADIVLSKSDPRAVIEAIRLSRATYRKMVQNLVWGAGYNIVILPLATGMIGGIVISPAVGAVLMSASTIIVAVNAQLLRRA